MQKLAPIALFVYNRPTHLERTLNSLKENTLAADSELFVFSDGPKNEDDKLLVDSVRKFISKIDGFKKVIVFHHDKNLGLANSVIYGVSKIFENKKKAIVIEDDMIFSTHFLKFMNNALNYYEDAKKVHSITGYKFPIKLPKHFNKDIFFAKRASSWGWGTWKSRWDKADWKLENFWELVKDRKFKNSFNEGGVDLFRMLKNQMTGKIDSWAIRWCYNHYINNAYCVYPAISLIKNIGTDNSGTHIKTTNKFDSSISENFNPTL